MKGHALLGGGTPAKINSAGNRIGWLYETPDVPGVSECECGTTSPDLPDREARQAWHQEHAKEIAERRNRKTVKACESPTKQAHESKADAVAHLLNLKKKDGAFTVSAYRCPAGHWHVGHRPTRRR